MATLTFTTTLDTQPKLLLTPEQLLERHFWGLPTCNSQGQEIPMSVIAQKILDAQADVENVLGIKLFPQVIRQTADYHNDQFRNYGFVRTYYNVQKPLLLEGWYNKHKQVSFPSEWLNTQAEQTSRPGTHGTNQGFRTIYMMPNGGSATFAGNAQALYSGAYNFRNVSFTPNYWRVTYLTGFVTMPLDILTTIEKLAAIPILAQLGDTYLSPGISSQSISLDGLSQTMSTTRNSEGGVYNSRIKQYVTELTASIETLKMKYRGVVFDIL